MKITKTLYVKNRRLWRNWLAKHHNHLKEVWLIYYKKHSGKPRIAYYDAVDEALCFGWIDSTVKTLDHERFTQRFSPRQKRSVWSATNAARYKALLKAGLVHDSGKQVFSVKHSILPKRDVKVGAYAWHLTHTIGPNPTLAKRIKWHKEHQKNCGCRPAPTILKKHLNKKATSD